MTDDRIHSLIDSGLDRIMVSLNGFTKPVYEKIMVGLNYDKVFNNVHNLIRMRNEMNSDMEIRIRMVELDSNKDEQRDFLNYWNQFVRETDKVQLMPMHTWSGTIQEEEDKRISFYADKPCVSVFSSMNIGFDGRVQLCDSDINQRVVLGNVKNQSIVEIWQSEKFEQIRSFHMNSQRNNVNICRGCDHWSRSFVSNL